MDTAVLTLVLALAVASMAMVFAMVQFSTAIIAEPQRPAAIKVWGLTYAAAWIVIAMVLVRGAIATEVPWPQALAFVTLVVGGWGTFQAYWVWLGLSIERTSAQATGQAVALTPAKETILHRAGNLAAGGLIAVALAVIELGYARTALTALVAPGHRALAATLGPAVVGGALLIGGGIRLVLSRGQPMSHAEIEEDLRRSNYGPRGRTGPLRFRVSTYRHFGPAEGARAQEEVSIAAMKGAWRTGAWRRDHGWQTIFMMATGGLLMCVGGFGAAVVAGPPIAKVLCGGALAYTTFQLVAAVRRA
jgi:hypothetical protein